MEKLRIREVAELLGLLALIASVLLVALEVNQSNSLARQTTSDEINASFNEFHDLVIADLALAGLIARMDAGEMDFTPAEAVQIQSLANRLFNTWGLIGDAYNNELITEAEYNSLSQDIPRSLEWKIAIPVWQYLLDTYPEEKGKPIFEPLMRLRLLGDESKK